MLTSFKLVEVIVLQIECHLPSIYGAFACDFSLDRFKHKFMGK